jgi:LysM repeat protein
MNFWSDSVKLDSPSSSENFYFELETPRGHFFAVLDFAPHDYANLDATLKLKLETILGSFDSVPKFSTDLFLGFLAKEINNFLYDLGNQSDGPQLFCSAALCLISGNRLAYFLCGDIKASILDSRRWHSLMTSLPIGPLVPDCEIESRELSGPEEIELDELGVGRWNGPLTDQIPVFILKDDDVVLITTGGGEEIFEQAGFSTVLQDLWSSDPKSICDSIIEHSTASLGDMTLLVICGPYDPYVDPVLRDLSMSVESLEARVNALAESGQRIVAAPDLMERTFEAELEQRINPQIDELKDALNRKANSIDVLELNEILKNFGLVLANKADTTELLSLQRDILKLGIDANENLGNGLNGSDGLTAKENGDRFLPESRSEDSSPIEDEDTFAGQVAIPIPRQSSSGLKTAVLVFIVAIGAAFIGAWLQSRVLRKNPEVWAVKTSGNQIWINRMDQGGEGNVTLNLAAPLRSRGEQTFSSFADVKRYLDTITGPQTSADQTTVVAQTPSVQDPPPPAKLIAKSGEALKQSSHAVRIIPRKSSELNATAGKKPAITTVSKVAANNSSTASDATLKRDRRVSANSSAATAQARVATGDTLDKLARRYKTTSAELRKLNPQINERGVIRAQQKIVVPASSANDSKGRRIMLVKQAHKS